MKYTSVILLCCALVIALISLFGDDSYSDLARLRTSLEKQRQVNAQDREEIAKLRRNVIGLKQEDRALEKAARNELGLARQGELIFIFDNYIEESPSP